LNFPPAQKENRIFSEKKNLPLFPPAQKENRIFSEKKNLPNYILQKVVITKFIKGKGGI
jgi:hypothetical protein